MDLTYEQYLALLHTLPIENPKAIDLAKFCFYTNRRTLFTQLITDRQGQFHNSIALPPLQADNAYFSLNYSNMEGSGGLNIPTLELGGSVRLPELTWPVRFPHEAISYSRYHWPNRLHDISPWQTWGVFKLVKETIINIYWVLVLGSYEIENTKTDQMVLSERLNNALILPTLDSIESKEYFLAQTRFDVHGRSSYSGKLFCSNCGFEMFRARCECCGSVFPNFPKVMRVYTQNIVLPLKIYEFLKINNIEIPDYNQGQEKERGLWQQNHWYNVFYWPD